MAEGNSSVVRRKSSRRYVRKQPRLSKESTLAGDGEFHAIALHHKELGWNPRACRVPPSAADFETCLYLVVSHVGNFPAASEMGIFLLLDSYLAAPLFVAFPEEQGDCAQLCYPTGFALLLLD